MNQSESIILPATHLTVTQQATTPSAGGIKRAIAAVAGATAACAYASGVTGTFAQAASIVFVSELGDKSFFFAALLAARTSKLLTFVGCTGALFLNSGLSVAIGQGSNSACVCALCHTDSTAPCVRQVAIGRGLQSAPTGLLRGLPRQEHVAIAALLLFGARSLIDSFRIKRDDGKGIAEERAAAEKTLKNSGVAEVKGGWPLVAEAGMLTLAAELGDRSQLAVIALSAASDPTGVLLGSALGTCLAIGLAVLGGSYLSRYLSERIIGTVSGLVFLVCGLLTLIRLMW